MNSSLLAKASGRSQRAARLAPKRALLARRVLRRIRMGWARMSGAGFECSHLTGLHDTDMGIVINSDLSVTCNSDDMYGNGKLGSLAESSLDEILQGTKASRFRKDLAAGRLPINECANCPGLVSRPKNYHLPALFHGRISSVLIENTAKCNVHCLSCNRPSINASREILTMDTSAIDSVHAALAPYALRRIRFLNLGEPFASKNILAMIKPFRSAFPDAELISSTNGALLRGRDKIEAALMLDELNFTIPGIDQASVERYQIGQDFGQAYQNLKNLVRERDRRGATAPVIIWKYLIFRWNDADADIERAIDLASEAGVDIIRFVVCWSPVHAISLRYMFRGSLPSHIVSSRGSRHELEVVGHRHFDVRIARPSCSTARRVKALSQLAGA